MAGLGSTGSAFYCFLFETCFCFPETRTVIRVTWKLMHFVQYRLLQRVSVQISEKIIKIGRFSIVITNQNSYPLFIFFFR